MADALSTYVPINCEFHDLLESLASSGRPAHMRFRDAKGREQLRTLDIVDLYASNGGEYLLLSTGETLRLDQLLEVNGQFLQGN